MATAPLKDKTLENDERDGFLNARTKIALLLFLLLSIGSASVQNLSFGLSEARSAPERIYQSSNYEVWLNVLRKEGHLWLQSRICNPSQI